jgi:hypothetical protein
VRKIGLLDSNIRPEVQHVRFSVDLPAAYSRPAVVAESRALDEVLKLCENFRTKRVSCAKSGGRTEEIPVAYEHTASEAHADRDTAPAVIVEVRYNLRSDVLRAVDFQRRSR